MRNILLIKWPTNEARNVSVHIFVLDIQTAPAKRLVTRFLLILLGECFDRADFC